MRTPTSVGINTWSLQHDITLHLSKVRAAHHPDAPSPVVSRSCAQAGWDRACQPESHRVPRAGVACRDPTLVLLAIPQLTRSGRGPGSNPIRIEISPGLSPPPARPARHRPGITIRLRRTRVTTDGWSVSSIGALTEALSRCAMRISGLNHRLEKEPEFVQVISREQPPFQLGPVKIW